ncbi:PepSY domain-containing protein [Lysinibacillus sp. 54212]|uniref:PepSY domain-containing protein n=1 Tax=Lysinibacillus sp. 54212 TaxID=3119829 RepID=UPI002FC82406
MLKKLQAVIGQQIDGMDEIEDSHSYFYGDNIAGDLFFTNGTLTQIQVDVQENEEYKATIIEVKALAEKAVRVFDNRPLKLDVMIDFDTHYLAIFEQHDDKYSLPLPNTGAQISISYGGRLTSAIFYHPEITVQYDELISAQEAKGILQREDLMLLSIVDEPDWHYAYTANHDIVGVNADGTVERLSHQPELSKMGYDPLPKITSSLSFDTLLQGDQSNVIHEKNEDNDSISYYLQPRWDREETEGESVIVENYSKQQLFERACEVLHHLVGEEYHNYKLLRDDGIELLLKHAPFYIEMPSVQRVMTFQFVYFVEEIGLHFHPAEVYIDVEFATMESLSLYKLPYEKLKSLPQPIVSVEQANAIAKGLVDVELSFQRKDLENNVYSLIYNMDYPPHEGNIEKIDAYTGEVNFIETGFIR